MSERTQKILGLIFIGCLLIGASDFAYRDMTEDKETAQILRDCGINPTNGEYLPRPNLCGK